MQRIVYNRNMTFKPGQSGNPAGKKKGIKTSPLVIARDIVLNVFINHRVEFEAMMNKAAKQNPIGYYLKFVAPFMPREFDFKTDDYGGSITLNVVNIDGKSKSKVVDHGPPLKSLNDGQDS
jgi:hypothetical protein